MNVSKTKKTAQDTASSADVHLKVPTSWAELTQEQLRYILTLLSQGVEGAELKTFIFIRFAGITIHRRSRDGWKCSIGKRVFYMQRWQVQFCIEKMKFIDSYEDMDVRLDGVSGLHAVDALLHGVRFYEYLRMDIAYQGFMRTKKDEPLRSLASWLYRDDDGKATDGKQFDKAELLGAYLWFAHVKRVFAAEFPDFFRPAPSSDSEDYDVMAATNAQIRALTDGDVTKEKAVYDTDTWRALTELDAKAREAKEMKARLSKKK